MKANAFYIISIRFCERDPKTFMHYYHRSPFTFDIFFCIKYRTESVTSKYSIDIYLRKIVRYLKYKGQQQNQSLARYHTRRVILGTFMALVIT